MATKEPVRVLVTGATGDIGRAITPMIAGGVMLGTDQPIILHLSNIPPAAEALNDVKMGLVDAAFPLLKHSVTTTDVVEACNRVNIAVMDVDFSRKEGMEGKDFMSIYKSQASALEKHAAANCKSEDEGNIRQMKEHIEMIFNQVKEMETRAGTELHYYSSRIDEFDRHANRAFENVCNKIEFLEREIANLESKLANAQVYLHGAFQEVAKWRQLYWNLRSRVIPSRVSVPVPNAQRA